MYVALCSCTNKEPLTVPQIRTGIAKVTGKIVNYPTKKDEALPLLKIMVQNPVTVEIKEYTTRMNEDGSFSFDIPLECNTIATIVLGNYSPGVCLVPEEETKIVIECKDDQKIKITMDNRLGLTSGDMENISSIAMDISHGTYNDRKITDYKLAPTEFSRLYLESLDAMQKYIDEYPTISNNAKTMISIVYKLFNLEYPLLDYERSMRSLYISHIQDSLFQGCVLSDSLYALIQPKIQKIIDNFTPQKPDRSYYSFLKQFDLNNPKNLYAPNYSGILQFILSNDIFAIPPIGNTSIDEWLKEIKKVMVDLIGSDTGLFYDMLAANAYAKQFNDKSQALSEIQKENIKSYFKNQSFVEILLKKNEEITKIAAITSHFNSNEIPNVPHDKLMDAIVSKYKRKVIVVDFWATWCEPCMKAISESRELKLEMLNKDVVFVYITNRSSPKKLWEEKIPGIGGEHYYLDRGEWENISNSDKYGFDAIPTYLLYDADGTLKNKITGYPGTDEMRKMIEELLP
jgi:thiol-disulfide isomerase/thioredoxin